MNQMNETSYSNFRKHGDYCFKGPGGADKDPVAKSVFMVLWCLGGC